jgi:hypothetical protein
MEHLRAFSTLVLVDFPQSEDEASVLLYSLNREPRHSHQYHRVFSGATASRVAMAPFHQFTNRKEVPMTRYASFIALAAFLTFGLGTAMSFAGEPVPAEQKEQKDKKDISGSKADDEKKKDEKKDMGGK